MVPCAASLQPCHALLVAPLETDAVRVARQARPARGRGRPAVRRGANRAPRRACAWPPSRPPPRSVPAPGIPHRRQAHRITAPAPTRPRQLADQRARPSCQHSRHLRPALMPGRRPARAQAAAGARQADARPVDGGAGGAAGVVGASSAPPWAWTCRAPAMPSASGWCALAPQASAQTAARLVKQRLACSHHFCALYLIDDGTH